MIIVDIFVAITGLVLGSFLYTTAIRQHGNRSLWKRSRCPQCGNPIGVIGLLPVLGYIAQWGKCRHCKGRISIRYPLMETANGGFAYLIYLKTGWNSEFFHYLPIFEILLLIAILDFETHLIYSRPIVVGLLFQTVWLCFLERTEVLNALLGLSIGAGIFHWIAYLYQAVRNRTGLGSGDATLLGFIGYAFGWSVLFPTIFWAALLGILGGVVTLCARGKSLQSEIAFGPWLVVACFLVWFWPDFFQSFPFRPFSLSPL